MAAANTVPIYSKVGVNTWNPTDADGPLTAGFLKSANTNVDGTGTMVTIFTADLTNGSRVDRISIRAAGTNTATVLRVFVNNGSASNATNTALITEVTCPATAVSQVAALADVTISGTPFPMVLAPGYKLMVTIGTAVAAGLRVTAWGGNY